MEIEQGNAYYWINNQIVMGRNYSEDLLELPNEGYKDFINVPSFDPDCGYRPFGMFVATKTYSTSNSFSGVALWWNVVEPKDIPKEFLTQLLLLGVNTNES